ncbi:MAG: hypothetical protein AAGE01_04000 [Pseudomonadota bacterium]
MFGEQQPAREARGGASALIFLALLAIGLPGAAAATRLGELTVDSFLGRPFKATAAVLAGDDGPPPLAVRVRIGTAEEYARLGVVRPALVDEITVRWPGPDQGIELATEDRINDLFVDIVLVLETPGSRSLRHYPVLLDYPPAHLPSATPVVLDEARRNPPPPPEAEVVAGDSLRYGPVRSGQTLYGIAEELAAGTGTGIDDMADAIYRLNPDAFLRGNRNRLRAGARLVLPGASPPEPVASRAPRAPRAPGGPAEPDRVELLPPPEPDQLADGLAGWIEADDETLLQNAATVARDINFARTEIETYARENQRLNRRVENLEERIERLREVLALQQELEERDRATVETTRGVAARPTSATTASGGIDVDPETTALPAAVEELEDPFAASRTLPDLSALTWFPYLGGLLVCILCGVLFHLRAEAERREERKRYQQFHQMHKEVRSYLPDEL